jgi:hypothetical protein
MNLLRLTDLTKADFQNIFKIADELSGGHTVTRC